MNKSAEQYLQLTAAHVERFWSLVDSSDPDVCWPWRGRRTYKGLPYGVYRGGFKIPMTASRLAYALHNRLAVYPPPELFVIHSCDNPPCCNPKHLSLGTNTDNMRDMWSKGRARNWFCERRHDARGEGNGRAVLTWPDVATIRASPLPSRVLARQFGCSERAVRSVRTHETWRQPAMEGEAP